MTNYILRSEAVRRNCITKIAGLSVEDMPPQETGEYTAADIKTLMKAKFSPRKLVCGEMIPTATSNLNSAQMAQFMEQVSAFALTYGVALTQPNDVN